MKTALLRDATPEDDDGPHAPPAWPKGAPLWLRDEIDQLAEDGRWDELQAIIDRAERTLQ